MNGIITVNGAQGHVAYPHLAANPVPQLAAMVNHLSQSSLDAGTEHFQPSNLEITSFDVGNAIRFAGKHSIVIYLTFFIPMKVAQKGLAMTGLIPDVGWASLSILVFALAAPLAFHFVVRKTPLAFLYERPAMFRINNSKTPRPAKETIGPVEA